MPFIYSIMKSYKLNKISRIIAKDMGNFSVERILDSTASRKKEKAVEDIFKFCETDRFIKKEQEHHRVSKKELEELYLLLLANGAAQWARGHFVLVSIFFFNQTLDYCLSREKLGITVTEMIYRCIEYYEKGERALIIPHWSQNQ
mgnify:CR=1 FL=1